MPPKTGGVGRPIAPGDGAPVADLLHAQPAPQVVARLDSDSDAGLSDAEARERRARFGPNRLPAREHPDYLRIALHTVADPLVILLILAAVVSFGIGERIEAAVILSIVVLNGILGFYQESSAQRAVIALRRGLERQTSVIRGGREHQIPVEELVPGDLLVLREGDLVPADARIVHSLSLEIVEAALTGESLPVVKQPEPVEESTPLAERASMVYAGTGVTRGRGTAVVTGIAAATEMGQIAALAAEAKSPQTPLQQRLASLTKAMVFLGVAVVLVLGGGMLARGEPLEEAFLVGVSVAVAAVPEGLAAIVTIALAQGARAMAGRGAIATRLPAVETLGSATVIAADKTGTLTLNQLHIAAVALPGRQVAQLRTDVEPGPEIKEFLSTAVLATEAELIEEDGGVRVAGDPADGAFLLAALDAGLAPTTLIANRSLVHSVPFDPERKRMTAVYQGGDGHLLVTKGAPETMLSLSSRVASNSRVDVLDENWRQDLEQTARDWASQGFRVMAVGERHLSGSSVIGDDSDDELTHLGLVALQDPLRPEAAAAIGEARAAGLKVVMLTGDHPLTAQAIAEQLELGAVHPLTGTDLEQLEPEEVAAALQERSVFARVTPADKLHLVEALQKADEVVAVTGDGINDTPALRRADVGVAMGKSGTEAAREAAELVLTDDDFGTIVAAVREGRRITDNVRKFVAFLLSANLGEVFLFAVAVLAGLGVPMTVVQVLTVNLLTDGLPAVALSWDPASPDVMKRGPRARERLLPGRVWAALGVIGLAVGLAGLGAYLAGLAFDNGAEQTMAFVTIAVAELVFVFSSRSLTTAAWREPRNRLLFAAVVASLVLIAALFAVPALREPFGIVPLTAAEWVVVLVLVPIPAIVAEIGKASIRWRMRRGEPPT